MSFSIPPSGRRPLQEAAEFLREGLKHLDRDSEVYEIFQKALNRLNYGHWLDEEHLKAMRRTGWRDSEISTWLPDDFDDE